MTLALADLPLRAFSPEDASCLSDEELLAEQRAFAAARRLIDAGAAAVAAEIAHRSRRELGYDGLAARRGARSPEALIQSVTGVSAGDARTMVRVGSLVASPASSPWLEPVVSAVTSGELSLEAAEAIRAGLGEPSDAVTHEQLALAASRLRKLAAGVSLEKLARLARGVRDELDTDDIARREEELRDQRYLSIRTRSDGLVRVDALLDPETAARTFGPVQARVRLLRKNPKFVDGPARAVSTDTRTLGQLMADVLAELVDAGARANKSKLVGGARAGARVHVAERDLIHHTGYASIEGSSMKVSIETAQRIACDAGLLPIAFDKDGKLLNVGREQRLYDGRQKTGMAARDGGCPFPDCDTPPGMCDAHHINEWLRDTGQTNIDDGILLCRFHHLLVHNLGWRITREGANYFAVPPPQPDGTPTDRISLQPVNSLIHRLEGWEGVDD